MNGTEEVTGLAPWDRAAAGERLARETWDVVVVGGGITGAGVARDAALRGLGTALVEARDWGSGASSRTTKFVHGGLRYLAFLDFRLVRESLVERGVLLRTAPHLVRPTPFLLPLHAGPSRRPWEVWLGLALYDALAGGARIGAGQVLDARTALAREPCLEPDGLLGAGLYWDARGRDTRLVIETVADARRAGAVALSRAAVGPIERWGEGWVGEVEDRVEGTSFALCGRTWVNATGAWSDRIRRRVAPERAPLLDPTKGVHVVVARDRAPVRDPVAIVAPDGRLLFVVPEGRWTYVGTTDTRDGGEVDDLSVDSRDVLYLLEAVRAGLDVDLEPSDVIGTWAGWRPLVRDSSLRRPSAVSREEAIETTAPGFLTVAGGKLTTYRRMAEDTVDRLFAELGRPPPPCRTARRPLVPEPARATPPPRCAAPGAVARARELFGPGVGHVFRRWRETPETQEPLGEDLPHSIAEAQHAALEGVASLDDLIDRRLGVLPLGIPVGERTLHRVASVVGEVVGWGERRRRAEIGAFRSGEAASPAAGCAQPAV